MKLLIIFITFLGLTACKLNPSQIPPNKDLIKQANPTVDARAMITQNKIFLLGFDRRGLVVPGLSQLQINSSHFKCEIKRIQNMGDTIHNQTEKTLMKAYREYSLKFNLKMIEATSCHQ